MLTCFYMLTFQNLKILKNVNCQILDRMSLWFCLLCNFSQCSNQSVLKYMISRYFYKVFLLFHTLRSDGPIFSLHEGYCHYWFCVCQRVLLWCLAETQTKHSQMVIVNFNSCWPLLVYVLSSQFLEIISTKQGKFDESREQLYKCLFKFYFRFWLLLYLCAAVVNFHLHFCGFNLLTGD